MKTSACGPLRRPCVRSGIRCRCGNPTGVQYALVASAVPCGCTLLFFSFSLLMLVFVVLPVFALPPRLRVALLTLLAPSLHKEAPADYRTTTSEMRVCARACACPCNVVLLRNRSTWCCLCCCTHSALVMLDFGLRHGFITPDEPGYAKICHLLRAGLSIDDNRSRL